MKIKSDSTARITQERHKKYFDQSVRVEEVYSPEDCVFVYGLAGHNLKADERAQETWEKLHPRKNGSFKATSVQSQTITLDEDEPENTVSIHRVSFDRIKEEVKQKNDSREQPSEASSVIRNPCKKNT